MSQHQAIDLLSPATYKGIFHDQRRVPTPLEAPQREWTETSHLLPQHAPQPDSRETPLPADPTQKPNQNSSKPRSLLIVLTASVAAVFIVSMMAGYTVGMNGYSNPSVREAFNHAWDMETRRRDDLRRQWQFELDTMRDERDEWQQERRRRTEEAEKKEAVQRANVKFETPSPRASCSSYGTREYSAKLLNVPDNLNAMELCSETAVTIHGAMKQPSYCKDNGKRGGVFGHWVIDFQEAACAPYFSKFEDKGCSTDGSGIRTFHSRLENLRPSDDWMDMCSTTPADFLQHHFDSPAHCSNWGIYGIWGIWDVPDVNCQ